MHTRGDRGWPQLGPALASGFDLDGDEQRDRARAFCQDGSRDPQGPSPTSHGNAVRFPAYP